MIFIHPDLCPKTKAEAYRLQEQTNDLHDQMKLVDHALMVLQETYFRRSAEHMQINGTERAVFAASYGTILQQIETICVLFEDCLAYIALLRGENMQHERHIQETLHCAEKIRSMYDEECICDTDS